LKLFSYKFININNCFTNFNFRKSSYLVGGEFNNGLWLILIYNVLYCRNGIAEGLAISLMNANQKINATIK